MIRPRSWRTMLDASPTGDTISNSLIMPMWTWAENAQRCRPFARDLSDGFEKELEVHGQPTADGIEGGGSVRGQERWCAVVRQL